MLTINLHFLAFVTIFAYYMQIALTALVALD